MDKVSYRRIIVKDISLSLSSQRQTAEILMSLTIIDIGFNIKNIVNFNICRNKSIKNLSNDIDVIYLLGGSTYYILDRLRKLGIDKMIKKFANKGGVFIGISAGSIIAGKDVKIAGWGSEADSNDIGLKDLRGLGLTDIAVFPHYKLKLKNEVKEFREKVDYPVFELRDGEALAIAGNKINKVGKRV